MTSWAASWKIPLIGRQSEAALHEREKSLRKFSVVKPGRRLGASWICDKVGARRPVVLCGECILRYKGWWKKEDYLADWGWNYIGDCDGCSLVGCRVTLFHARERFHDVLSAAHGRGKQP